MKIVKVKRVSDNRVIHEIDVTGKSERFIDRMVDGMMINLNHQDYWIDDSCEDEAEHELVRESNNA